MLFLLLLMIRIFLLSNEISTHSVIFATTLHWAVQILSGMLPGQYSTTLFFITDSRGATSIPLIFLVADSFQKKHYVPVDCQRSYFYDPCYSLVVYVISYCCSSHTASHLSLITHHDFSLFSTWRWKWNSNILSWPRSSWFWSAYLQFAMIAV